MRKPLVVGNWKMHGSRESVTSLLDGLLDGTPGTVDVAVCPVYIHLAQAIEQCANSEIAVGAQDCSQADSGAYTGEVSASMLADIGASCVILGHSERRAYHGESDELVAGKLTAAVTAGLLPIVCVGETREQREAGEAESVVKTQILGALSAQSSLDGLVVAYEPVWAIGTGLTATPEQAQAMHALIRATLDRVAGVDAAATRVLYGGSVKPGNAAELFSQQDIDGALVGGAALEADDFRAIYDAAAS